MLSRLLTGPVKGFFAPSVALDGFNSDQYAEGVRDFSKTCWGTRDRFSTFE
jgi:hypothetical protein